MREGGGLITRGCNCYIMNLTGVRGVGEPNKEEEQRKEERQGRKERWRWHARRRSTIGNIKSAKERRFSPVRAAKWREGVGGGIGRKGSRYNSQ